MGPSEDGPHPSLEDSVYNPQGLAEWFLFAAMMVPLGLAFVGLGLYILYALGVV